MVYTQVTSYRKGKEHRKQIYAEKSHVKAMEMYKATHPEEADCILVAEEYKGLSEESEDTKSGDSVGCAALECDFVSAIKEAISECVRTGNHSTVQRTDERGDITTWVEAAWTEVLGGFEVVELFICYVDTGRVAYSKLIHETKRVRRLEETDD